MVMTPLGEITLTSGSVQKTLMFLFRFGGRPARRESDTNNNTVARQNISQSNCFEKSLLPTPTTVSKKKSQLVWENELLRQDDSCTPPEIEKLHFLCNIIPHKMVYYPSGSISWLYTSYTPLPEDKTLCSQSEINRSYLLLQPTFL